MMEKEYCYRFAGVAVRLIMPEERFCRQEQNLALFRAETVDAAYEFRYSFLNSLEPSEGQPVAVSGSSRIYRSGNTTVRYLCTSEGNGYIRISQNAKRYDVQVLDSYITGPLNFYTLMNTLSLEHLVAREKGFLFHSSYIGWEGKAILFTAPSGTGKSTQADLWKLHRGAQILNGDRSVIRDVNGQIIAAGIPFAGSSTYCVNCSLPIAAVVYLEQAPVTSIRRLRGFEAIRRLWEGASVNAWDQEDMRLVSDVMLRTAETVPMFHLACTPDISAVLALEQALRK